MRLAAAALLLAVLARAARLDPPPGNKVYFGAWLNLSDDAPIYFDQRMRFSGSSFQLSQDIPLTPYDWVTGAGGPINHTAILQTQTDAIIFMTVYPTTTLDLIQDADLIALGNQIRQLQDQPFDRRVLLRYAPEMQGRWFPYGFSPSTFVPGWKRMYQIVKGLAPDTQIVWAPNQALGYPYGQTLSQAAPRERALLDTDSDGDLSPNDDAYSPWFPGFDYIDWAGISYYQKGPSYPYTHNVNMPPGSLEICFMGNAPSQSVVTPFYPTYCSAAKPCLISEAGAAYHVNTTDGPGVGQLNLEQTWWRSSWTNVTFWDTFPYLKMVQLFEFWKVEENEARDYRITVDDQIRTAFLADIAASVPDRFEFASYKPSPITTETAMPTPGRNSRTSTNPSLFSAASERRWSKIVVATLLVAVGVAVF